MKMDAKSLFISVILFASVFTLIIKLLTPTPIQIIVSGEGKPIVVRELVSYTLTDVFIIVFSTILVCICSFYMFFMGFLGGRSGSGGLESFESDVNFALRLLDGDQKMVFSLIVESGGEILQSELVRRTGFSRAKITRILNELEFKGLIIRRRYGMTNKIVVKRDLRLTN